MKPETNRINTGIKFFGLRVWLDSTGEPEIDKAAKSVFKDHYRKSAPLLMSRDDVKRILEWSRRAEGRPDGSI